MIQRIHKSLSKTITSIRSNNQIQCQDLGPPGTTWDHLGPGPKSNCGASGSASPSTSSGIWVELDGDREPLCFSPKSKRTPIEGSWRKPISYDVNLVNFLNFGLPAQFGPWDSVAQDFRLQKLDELPIKPPSRLWIFLAGASWKGHQHTSNLHMISNFWVSGHLRSSGEFF